MNRRRQKGQINYRPTGQTTGQLWRSTEGLAFSLISSKYHVPMAHWGKTVLRPRQLCPGDTAPYVLRQLSMEEAAPNGSVGQGSMCVTL